ncbi:MAG: hypothetical protein JWP89_2625 [Schlesneria sp.]|nr:hypothetical protein [Schlesneria sp.]
MPFSTKEFPTRAELKRVQDEHEYFKFYDSEVLDPDGTTDRAKFRLKEFFENDSKKAKILDIALNVAPVIIDAGTDFAFGRLPTVEIEDSGDSNGGTQKQIDEIVVRNRLMHRMRDSSTLFQGVGHSQFKLFAENGKALVNELPYHYWFPNWEGVPVDQDTKNVRIVSYLSKFDGSIETKYIYIEDYYLDSARENKLTIARSLWEDQGAKIGGQVPITTLSNLKALGDADPSNSLTILEITEFDFLPFVKVDVRKNVMRREAQSILKKCRPLLYELNDRLTQVSIQFVKHLNAILMIPNGAVVRKKDGSIDHTKLDVLLANPGEDAKYVTNENPLIEQAFVHIEKCLRAIAKETQTPDSFLVEDEKGGVETAESLRTRLFLFISRIERYQQIYEEAILDTIRKCLKIEGVENVDALPITVTFESSLPKDWQHDVEVWGSAKSMGLASKETAVSRFQGIKGQELEDELVKIADEEQQQQESMLKLIDQQNQDPKSDPNAPPPKKA